MNTRNKTLLSEMLRINSELRKLGFINVKPKSKSDKPVNFWIEKEPVRDQGELKIYDALVIILGTKGCRWAWMGSGGGCVYCGYVYKNPREGGDLLKQIDNVISRTEKNARNINVIKIFTSGSFLDDFEVEKSVRYKILEILLEKYSNLKIIQLEARPEHLLVPGRLDELKHIDADIYFNIGLESADDQILRLINKGFTFKIYQKALEKAHENGYKMKTYLMLKQPFQTEAEAINDTISSGYKVLEMGSDALSVNPMVVYSYTLVEFLWKRGLYRPPWLNSVVFVLKKLLEHDIASGRVIISDPVASGSKRGPHSCNKACDKKLVKVLEKMVMSQDPDIEIPDCCYEEWRQYLVEEDIKKDLSYCELLP